MHAITPDSISIDKSVEFQMAPSIRRLWKIGALSAAFISLSACVGGGGSNDSDNDEEQNKGKYETPVIILDGSKFSAESLTAMAVADFNQDGFDDFVGARTSGFRSGPATELLLMINDKNGSLTDQTAALVDGPIPTFFWSRDVHVGDFNGDNKPDIFFSNHGKEPLTGPSTWSCEQNTLLLSQPNGKLKDVTSTHLPARFDFSHGSSIADIDADGDLDIWVTNLGCGTTILGYLLRNDGNGMFTDIAGLDHRNGILPADFKRVFWSQFIDINSDGYGDLFYTDLADNNLLFNNGNGSFSVVDDTSIPDAVGTVTTQGSKVADLNNDGFDDLVLFQTDASYSPGFSLQILIHDGNSGFTDETSELLPPQNSTTAVGFPALWIGDINGDNSIDIMVRLHGEGFQGDNITDFYLNDGAGKFTELSADQLPPILPDFAPIDVNNDGKVDFIFKGFDSAGRPSMMLSLAR
ncbi:MAG: FG-GAP repeat domain-containing protein [Granulosicoccaceae bacterium]